MANNEALGFAQYDSWLTIGITDGDTANAISMIGVNFDKWDESTPLTSDTDTGGAVFWMNPDSADDSVSATDRSMVVAQLTIATSSTSQMVNFAAQGRSHSGQGIHAEDDQEVRDWEETCIDVKVGGTENGQGTHCQMCEVAPPPSPSSAGPPAPPDAGCPAWDPGCSYANAGSSTPSPPPSSAGDSCTFEYHSSELSWFSAEQACARANPGGHLATLRSDADRIRVNALMPSRTGTQFWIGLNDRADEALCEEGDAKFVWSSDDSPATYTHWAPHQPDNYDVHGRSGEGCPGRSGTGSVGDNGEDCVSAGMFGGDGWNDGPCGWEMPFVCSYCDGGGSDAGGSHAGGSHASGGGTSANPGVCDVGSLQASFTEINAVCCRDAGLQCSKSPPPTCSHDCAEVVGNFWSRCEQVMQVMSAGGQMRGFSLLDEFQQLCTRPANQQPPPPPPPPRIPPPPPPASTPVAVAVSDTPWLSLFVPSSPSCQLRDIRSRIAELDAICCVGIDHVGLSPSASECDPDDNHGAPRSCLPMCGGKLLQLERDCNDSGFLDILFDGMDGQYDGRATVLRDLRERCLSVPSNDVIRQMQILQDAGCHVNDDGVAEITVPGEPTGDGVCRDVGPKSMCSLVQLGALSCETDFCADKDLCAHSGQCDKTCDLCTGDGGRHRLQINLDGEGSQCSMLNLESKVGPVNDACCDEDGGCNGGGAGVPTLCDARCAETYGPFYEECAATLQQAFAAQPLVLGAFSRLATTCDSLAVDQLLTAMGDATCSDLEPLVQPTAGGFGRWLDEQLDCPLGMLEHQLVDIDTACCGASLQALGDECFFPSGGSPDVCTRTCAATLLGANGCEKTIDLVLDGMDGNYDHSADIVDDLSETCRESTSVGDVLDEMKQMKMQGCRLDSDGVGETTVEPEGPDTCADTAPDSLCSLVTTGVLQCSVDFCPGGACPHPSACDRTCGYCQADGSADDSGGRRALQINIDTAACSARDFPARTDAVNTECCDETNDHCAAGVYEGYFLSRICA